MSQNKQIVNIIRPPCDAGVVYSAPDTAPCDKHVGSWVLAATVIGSSMVFIDGTVVNVALPALQTDLRATVVDLQWIIEAYALFLAALLLVGGALGDRFGRRRVYAVGVSLFAAASVWCGLARDANQLILARAMQGLGGALLVPGSLAIIAACFSDEQRGRAIGTWSGLTAITTALGPVMGGWLVEHISWRAIFFINVPLALTVLFILFKRVPESRNEESAVTLDWWGASFVTVGLAGIVYGLIESANQGFGSPLVSGALVVGAVLLTLFIIVEARGAAPMVPLTLFRSRTFSGANMLTLLLYAALSGALFFVPFNLIQVQGYSATAAGAAFLPLIVIIFLLSQRAGRIADRSGAKPLLIIGPLIVALGYVLFALPGIGGSYWTTFLPAMSVLGLGMAISVAPLTMAVMGSVTVHHSGLASGVNNAASRVAGLLAIAVFGIVILAAFNQSLDRRVATLDIPAEAKLHLDAQRIKLAGADVPAGLTQELERVLEGAIALSFVAGFRLVMLICSGLALASAVIAAVMIEGRKPAQTR